MGQGPIDHPSYLTRQTLVVPGIANKQVLFQFPFDARIRNVVGWVVTTGTTTPTLALISLGTSVQYPPASKTLVYGTATGTNTTTVTSTITSSTTVGSFALSTATTSGMYGCMGDMNIKVPAGQQMSIGFSTDATIVCNFALEWYIDPQSATWTGQN